MRRTFQTLNRWRIATSFYALYLTFAGLVGFILANRGTVSQTLGVTVIGFFIALIATEYAVEFSYKKERQNEHENQTLDLYLGNDRINRPVINR
jgi:mannose/fructose/N-acetylgalactosamine-specific phosphotransferase system component IIC